jgi:hypothetical protein
MKKIHTIFDYNTGYPQISVLFDCETKKVQFLPLFISGHNLKVSDAKNNLKSIAQSINSEKVMINDFLSHIHTFKKFNIGIKIKNVYENILYMSSDDEGNYKKRLLKSIIKSPEFEPWMKIKARSSIIYAMLNANGVMWGSRHEFPVYDTKTVTGRSRTRQFNIQGTTAEDPIKHINGATHLVCFDWVSADLRVAGYLSDDAFIHDSFLKTDPYTELELLLRSADISREDCKIETLKAIYSVDFDNPLLDIMGGLKSWMVKKVDEYHHNYNYKTMAGVPIEKKDLKTSFNGLIQGSVANALQSVLASLPKPIAKCILTEIHDSIIFSVNDNQIKDVIEQVVPVMMHPFGEDNINFQVKVSVGKQWKKWKTLKVYK